MAYNEQMVLSRLNKPPIYVFSHLLKTDSTNHLKQYLVPILGENILSILAQRDIMFVTYL